MSAAFRFLQMMSRQGQNRSFNSGGNDDLYSAGVEDALDAVASGEDMDSGAFGDRFRGWQAKRGGNLIAKSQKDLGRPNNNNTMQVAQAVATEQLGAEARRTRNKGRYKLYRVIPLVALASRADAATATISVTPTSKCFAEYIIATGVIRIDTLVFMGQSFLPNGAISTAPFVGTNNGLMPVNLYLDTVPITGGVTNNTGAAVVSAIDLTVWMEDTAASERY